MKCFAIYHQSLSVDVAGFLRFFVLRSNLGTATSGSSRCLRHDKHGGSQFRTATVTSGLVVQCTI